jgi:hypothetical protein
VAALILTTVKGIVKVVFIGLILSVVFIVEEANAQGKQAVQVSGVIIGEDSVSGVPNVHIYAPKAGRGTTSNLYGYFSYPFLAGDSVIISAVGYQKRTFIVPRNQGDNITVIIELMEDTTFLPEVEIFPYPTEKLFKEAILAMQLPDEDRYSNMRRNLEQETLARMFNNMPMDASMNYRYYMDQQFNNMGYKYGITTNPLLNPFAWANFIKSLKRGDLKRKD